MFSVLYIYCLSVHTHLEKEGFLSLFPRLEEGRVTYPSILAWRIPWTEEPGGLWSIGSQRIRLDGSNYAHTCMYVYVYYMYVCVYKQTPIYMYLCVLILMIL